MQARQLKTNETPKKRHDHRGTLDQRPIKQNKNPECKQSAPQQARTNPESKQAAPHQEHKIQKVSNQHSIKHSFPTFPSPPAPTSTPPNPPPPSSLPLVAQTPHSGSKPWFGADKGSPLSLSHLEWFEGGVGKTPTTARPEYEQKENEYEQTEDKQKDNENKQN